MLYSKKVYNISCIKFSQNNIQRITVSKNHLIWGLANSYINLIYNLKKIGYKIGETSIIKNFLFLIKVFCSKTAIKNYGQKIINMNISDNEFRQDILIKIFCLRFHPT